MKKVILFHLFALLLYFIPNSSRAEILIMTHSFNRPDLIEIQDITFKKFFLDDYRFVVFNDGPNDQVAHSIEAMCIKLGIESIRIPQEIHSRPYLYRWPGEDYQHSCCRCANVVQYSLDTLGFDHNDLVMIIDSDMFLIKPFSAREFLNEYQLAGFLPYWTDIKYLWNGLLFFDMNNLPDKRSMDFNCGKVNDIPVDVGGQTYHYLRNHPEVKVRSIKNYYSDDLHCSTCKSSNNPVCSHNTDELRALNFDDNQIEFMQAAHRVEFLHNNTFLHYRSAGNWNNRSDEYHMMKTKALAKYLETILSLDYK